jgi:penicillin-binding protein 2
MYSIVCYKIVRIITGYYPADRPKYVITAIVEGNTKGNKSAVPLFKEIC